MTIHVELSAETQARLAAQAAARSMDVPAYAAILLEHAAQESTVQRNAGRKSLAQLFAESPFKGLELDLEREADFGRDIAL
jgi:hypothetical protein